VLSNDDRLEPPERIMKVMAIGTLKPLTPEQRQRYLPAEVPATLQLYLDGKMEQFWLRDKEVGVIFLMSVDSVEEADRLLKALPLGQAELLTFDLMPIGPLLPLGMLMK
jgi:muconolactone delta-isomerase